MECQIGPSSPRLQFTHGPLLTHAYAITNADTHAGTFAVSYTDTHADPYAVTNTDTHTKPEIKEPCTYPGRGASSAHVAVLGA